MKRTEGTKGKGIVRKREKEFVLILNFSSTRTQRHMPYKAPRLRSYQYVNGENGRNNNNNKQYGFFSLPIHRQEIGRAVQGLSS